MNEAITVNIIGLLIFNRLSVVYANWFNGDMNG